MSVPSTWKIKKVVYFKKMKPGWQSCENWKNFILRGNEEIYDAMETDTEDLSGSDPHECKLRELVRSL